MTMKTIQVTVVFPQTFQIEIDDSKSIDEQMHLIKDHAAYLMETSQSNPIIVECNENSLVE